jgi:hypothetical protein
MMSNEMEKLSLWGSQVFVGGGGGNQVFLDGQPNFQGGTSKILLWT